jgi:putative SOS response-associated peptidase YedK
VPPLQVETGNFGLIPFWAKDDSIAKRTYNARSETVAEKPAFRDAWKKAQHCIIPATAIYEPDWCSGKAVPTRITRTDGELLDIAGLHKRRKAPDGNYSYSDESLSQVHWKYEVSQHVRFPTAFQYRVQGTVGPAAQ